MKVIEMLTLVIVGIVFGPLLVVITVLGPLAKVIGAILDLIGK